MQFKIPQEINVEDKVVGPFTLKSFGFVFAFFVVMSVFVVILTGAGISLVGSIIVGTIIGSPALVAGFVPYNGKPVYTYTGHFVTYLFKPRKRVWKKYVEPVSLKPKEEKKVEVVQGPPQKALLSDAEKQIEELSLMVDTGGAYSSMQKKMPADEPDTFMDKSNVAVEKALQETGERVSSDAEPSISDLASVDPDKKFTYEQPDTKSYKVDDVIGKEPPKHGV